MSPIENFASLSSLASSVWFNIDECWISEMFPINETCQVLQVLIGFVTRPWLFHIGAFAEVSVVVKYEAS